jgi:hypothetical protein
MISAGVMHKVAMRIGGSGGNGATSTKELTKNFTFGQRAALNVSKAVTNAGLSAAIQGQSFEKSLSRNLVAAGAATLVDPILKQVDTADSSTGEVDFGKQVLAHMGAGAITSVITNDPNGIAIGAMSGVINAVGARLAESDKAKKGKGKGKDKVEDTGREQDKEPKKTKQAKGKERVTNHGKEVEVPVAKIQNKKQQQTKDKYDLAEPKELTVKQQLFLKIKRQLEVQQRIAADNGQGFDLQSALNYTKQRINNSNTSELNDIQKIYDYAYAANHQTPLIQLTALAGSQPEKAPQLNDTYLDPEKIELMGYTATGELFAGILAGATEVGLGIAKGALDGATFLAKLTEAYAPENSMDYFDSYHQNLRQEVSETTEKIGDTMKFAAKNPLLFGKDAGLKAWGLE